MGSFWLFKVEIQEKCQICIPELMILLMKFAIFGNTYRAKSPLMLSPCLNF